VSIALYGPEQREALEARLNPKERDAVGGDLFDWRFRQNPWTSDAPCFALAERPGGPKAWASAVRTEVVADGAPILAAQVAGGDLARVSKDEALDRDLFAALFEPLGRSGVKLAFGAVEPAEGSELEKHGFVAIGEVAVRSLYLGFGLSRRVGSESLSPLRRIAHAAARIRTKLVEVELDSDHLARFAEAHATRSGGYSFAIHKTPAYLGWRYLRDPRAAHRSFVHRKRVGLGLDGFVVVRRTVAESGRVEVHVIDHWTREPGRRAHALFLGEVGLWAMTEEAEVVRAFAAAGTNLDQALLGMGGVRKKAERVLMVRAIGEGAPSIEAFDAKTIALRAGDLELYSSFAPPPRRSTSIA
jgi:hypothetical protein